MVRKGASTSGRKRKAASSTGESPAAPGQAGEEPRTKTKPASPLPPTIPTLGPVPENVELYRPFRPRGAAKELLYCHETEVIISGPAGTGKSRVCLEKMHLCAERYPGMRGLIMRKTRESLSESGLVTWEDKVVPQGHPCLEGPKRNYRQSYIYPNGSQIVIAGMDKPSKAMSTEYDLIFVQEAIELAEDEWEKLTTRLRNGVMPYQQLIADTNPDKPQHWIKLRCNSGQSRMLESRHEDNPVLWDALRGHWTEDGLVYLSKLDKLTGPRKDRLRYGKWVQAEGVVYEDWDPRVHLIDRFPIPHTWPRYWTIDFGFTNPFVWQRWAEDPDGRLYRYGEFYWTHRLVEDHARLMMLVIQSATQDPSVMNWSNAKDPRPRAVICDHDAEGRATLEHHLQLNTVPAYKPIQFGVQAMAARLRKAEDGKPRLLFFRDSLYERDPGLVEAKKPTCTEEEFDGYVWDTAGGRRKGEVPVDKDNHGMDATRYLCATLDRGTLSSAVLKGELVTSADSQRYPLNEDEDLDDYVRKTAGWRPGYVNMGGEEIEESKLPDWMR